MKFSLKDIVFAAVIAAAMNVLSFVTVPLVVAIPIPGIRVLVIAPFYGLLLALALMRIRKTGTATLVSFLAGAVLLFVGPVILLFLLASGIIADVLIYFFWRDMEKPVNVVLGSGTYLAAMVPFGAFFGSLMLQDTPLAVLMTEWWLVLLASLLAFLLGAAGAWLGVKANKELRGFSMMK